MVLLKKIAIACCLLVAVGCDMDLSDYRTSKFQEIKSKVEQEPAWVYMMQKVLDARHKSVRIKGFEVEDIEVKTLGDERIVKRDETNLRSIEVKFRISWDGSIHKDGYTCTTFVFDKDWNVKRILPGESNAKLDLDAPKSTSEDRPVGEKVSQVLQKAKVSVGDVVQAARVKFEELKPQVKKELKNLEMQVDAALRRFQEDLNKDFN